MARTPVTAAVNKAGLALMTPLEFEDLRAKFPGYKRKTYEDAKTWARGIAKGNRVYAAMRMQAAYSVTPAIRTRAAVIVEAFQ